VIEPSTTKVGIYEVNSVTSASSVYTISVSVNSASSGSWTNVALHCLSWSGSGASGTSGTSGFVNILNNVDNYVMTGTGTPGTINGEANLKFDGSKLTIDNGSTIDARNSFPVTRLYWDGVDTLSAGGDRTNLTYVFDQGISAITDWNEITSTLWQSLLVNGNILSQATAGATITAGQIVYLGTGGTWSLADADAESTSTPLLGIALTSATGGQRMGVLLSGTISTTYHDQVATPATPGLPLYISTTAGNVTQTQPTGTGDVVRLIGHNFVGISGGRANVAVIFFQPDKTWTVIE
jgi:hypothetical protein